MKKLLKLLVKLLIGIFLALALYISLYDVWLLIQKQTRIENFFWFFGQVPGVFAIVYLLNQKIKTKELRKLTSILGMTTFLLLAYTIYISNFIQLEHLMVAVFGLVVSVKILTGDFRKEGLEKETEIVEKS